SVPQAPVCLSRRNFSVEMISSCPICSIQVLTTELEQGVYGTVHNLSVPYANYSLLTICRHANSHFEDDQLQRDMELAHQISLANAPEQFMPEQFMRASTSDSNAGEASSIHSRYSSHFANVLDEQISCLVGAQIRTQVQEIEGGVMSLLKSCLESEDGSSTSIISGHIDHHQSLASEDKGWGCGWRNIQMMSSHLLRQRPEARQALFGGSGFVPDIPSLQRWLEIAWDKNFDTIGSSHFHNQVYGAKKWIGTTECATLFRSFGLRARIGDFDSTESSGFQNKNGKRAVSQVQGPMDKFVASALIDWAHSVSTVTDKCPLYFQHQGHSRTIVGIQKKKGNHGYQDQYTLLILDPGHRTVDLEISLRSKKGWQRMVKRGVHTLKSHIILYTFIINLVCMSCYQLCYVDSGLANLEEMEQLKTIDSILVRF
ncbi:hypothetical protein EJB05_48547, partial [Eragrostis curvula]